VVASVIDEAAARLAAKVQDASALPGVVKFVLPGEGSILMDTTGVHAGEGAADVTLTAETEVFQAILEGRLSAMSAYMSGKLKIEGQMALAMKLGTVLG
jgi:putative sterol carrier protein